MSKKTLQVSEVLRHKLTEIIARELEFPVDVVIAITKVETSPDQKYANFWVSCNPPEKMGIAYGILRDNKKELRHLLAEVLQRRVVPVIRFRADKSAMAVDEVERILEQIRKESTVQSPESKA